MNKVILMWNITQDVELKQTPNWQNVVQVWFATNETYTKDWQKNQVTEYHNLVAWTSRADFFQKYVTKWMKLLIEWKLQTQSWEKDWVKRYKTNILVSSVEFCWKKSDSHNSTKKKENEELTVDDIPF